MKGEGGNSIPKGPAAGRSVRARRIGWREPGPVGAHGGWGGLLPWIYPRVKRDLEWGRQEEPGQEAEVAGTRVGPWRRQGPWISAKWTRGLDKTVVSVPSALG